MPVLKDPPPTETYDPFWEGAPEEFILGAVPVAPEKRSVVEHRGCVACGHGRRERRYDHYEYPDGYVSLSTGGPHMRLGGQYVATAVRIDPEVVEWSINNVGIAQSPNERISFRLIRRKHSIALYVESQVLTACRCIAEWPAPERSRPSKADLRELLPDLADGLMAQLAELQQERAGKE